MSVITVDLLAEIKKHYPLCWLGTHGVIHWSHVYENGMKLSGQTGVNAKVVQYFSIFHDCQRRNEGKDDGHGARGAAFASKVRTFCRLDEQEFDLLLTACRFHTSVQNHDDITVKVCFDSDRLDLGRVGSVPNPDLLCSPLAQKENFIDWAYNKSLIREFPDNPFGIGKAVLSQLM